MNFSRFILNTNPYFRIALNRILIKTIFIKRLIYMRASRRNFNRWLLDRVIFFLFSLKILSILILFFIYASIKIIKQQIIILLLRIGNMLYRFSHIKLIKLRYIDLLLVNFATKSRVLHHMLPYLFFFTYLNPDPLILFR
jgi:hypothetical protein